MKTSLTLNNKDELALFYAEPLGFTPEWASVDIEQGEIYIGGSLANDKGRPVRLDSINQAIYERVKKENKILLVRVSNDKAKTPQEAVSVPLMIARQL